LISRRSLNKKEGKLKVKNILISQPKPADLERTPYAELIRKFNVKLSFEKFIKVEGISSQEFRQSFKIKVAQSKKHFSHISFVFSTEIIFKDLDSFFLLFFSNIEEP